MWYKKNKRIISLFMAMVMLTGVLVSNIQPSYIRAEGGGTEQVTGVNEDITKCVTVTLDEMYVADENGNVVEDKYFFRAGQPQTPQPKVAKNDGIQLKYKWDVSQENMSKVKPGNYFKIQLPDQSVLKSQIGTFKFTDKDNNEIGEFTVADGFLKATFTKDMSNEDRLENGYFSIFSMIIAKSGNINITTDYENSTSFTFEFHEEQGGGGQHEFDPGPFKKEFNSWKKQNITKSAWQDNWQMANGAIGSTIGVNYSEFDKLYSDSSITKKNNVVLIDELPKGLGDFRAIEIRTTVNAPKLNDDGSIDKDKVSPVELLDVRAYHRSEENMYVNVKDKFVTYVKGSNEKTWDEFQAEVKAKANAEDKFVVGIWKNLDSSSSDGGSKLIIAFGDLPASRLKYGDFYQDFDKEINNFVTNGGKYKTISQDMADVIKTIKDKPIIAFKVVVSCTITDFTQKQFTNTAKLQWNQNEEKTVEATTQVSSASGGVDYGHDTVIISAKKVWNDGGKDHTNDSVTLLLKDGDNTVDTLILNQANNWQDSFKEQRKYRSQQPIEYKVVEETVPQGYKVEYEGSAAIGNFTVTNSIEIPKIDINVEKKWQGKGDTALDDSEIPDEITVELFANGNTTDKTIILKKADGWKGKFKGLDKQYDKGDILYTVKELMTEDLKKTFVAEVTQPTSENEYKAVITNKATDQKIKVSIKKVWKNESGKVITDSIPSDVKLKMEILRYDGVVDGADKYTPVQQNIEISKSKGWKFTSDFLPKLDESDKEIRYVVREVEVPSGYRAASSYEYNNTDTFEFTITNSKIPKGKINVQKNWTDRQGTALQDERIPASVTLGLFANGKNTGKRLTITKNDGWKGTFTDLSVTDSFGQGIKYKVEEIAISGFDKNSNMEFVLDSTKADGETVVLTNREVEPVDIIVRKVWLDKNGNTITNKDVLPQTVRLQLFANGASKGSIYVNKDNNFVYSKKLPKYDVGGKEIVYEVRELEGVSGYRLESIKKADGGFDFTVTNKEDPYTPPYIPYIPPYTPINDDPVPTPPGTPTPPAPDKPNDDVTIEDDDVALADADDDPSDEDEPIDDDLPKANENLPKTHDLLNTFTNTFAVIAVSALGLGIKEISNIRRKKDDEK